MKRFSFSLAAVLRLREHREWERELELGGAISRCSSIQADIDTISNEYRQTVADAGGDHATDIEYRIWQTAYLSLLENRRDQRRQELVAAEQAREEIHARFLEAMRDRKVLSRLRERQETVYRYEQLRHEDKVLDDTTNARSARARSGVVRQMAAGNQPGEAESDGTI